MNYRMHRCSAVGVWAAIAAFLAIVAGTSAFAQPIAWNPPCTTSKIVNTTANGANVTISTAAGNVGPVFVGPFTTSPVVFPPGTFITGIVTQAGTAVGVVSPGPAIPSPPAPAGSFAAGWVSNVTFGPAPGFCYDVYFDATGAPGCYIWLLPSAAPPPCTP